jgi:hypothetical protein
MPKMQEQLIVCMFMMCMLFFLHGVVVHVCDNPVHMLPIDDFLHLESL